MYFAGIYLRCYLNLDIVLRWAEENFFLFSLSRQFQIPALWAHMLCLWKVTFLKLFFQAPLESWIQALWTLNGEFIWLTLNTHVGFLYRYFVLLKSKCIWYVLITIWIHLWIHQYNCNCNGKKLILTVHQLLKTNVELEAMVSFSIPFWAWVVQINPQ